MAFEGLTMNVELCENNPGSAQKMLYFRKNKEGRWGGGGGTGVGGREGFPLDPPLIDAIITRFK